MKPDPFWSDRFHHCVLAAGFIAASEGRLDDALYVRELAYAFYKEGAFRDRAARATGKLTA
jgi:hypothetical protein